MRRDEIAGTVRLVSSRAKLTLLPTCKLLLYDTNAGFGVPSFVRTVLVDVKHRHRSGTTVRTYM